MRIKDTAKEDNIKQKAIEMIVKEGLQGFGVNKLAKAAGVSPATIYIYFKDKEHLISTLCLEVGKEMLDQSLTDFNPEMSFEKGLEIQWKNRLAYFLKHPIDMEFLEIMRYTIFYEQVTFMMKRDFGAIMNEFKDNAQQNGQLIKLPFEVYWALAFSPLYQLVKFHTQGQSYVNNAFALTDQVMKQALSLVLKALKP
ncbi:MAG: TetR/AcrR family transcriptional regulator [Mucilaginibacter sp.]|uniref:TetR/AcrR family transcriptional regulator n=1 Tax=Mucilaginibacter sp. TaxID=1882438 RepID=UPI003266565B